MTSSGPPVSEREKMLRGELYLANDAELAAARLRAATTVETVVSTLVTDPWTHASRSSAT